MLKSIEINGLFGQYSYRLPLLHGQRKRICFLTGPNGYGKSTILRLIDAFMRADARYFMKIPFENITFWLNGYRVKIGQEWMEDIVTDKNGDSSEYDDMEHGRMKLAVEVYAIESDELLERAEFFEDEMPANGHAFPPSLSIYLDSQKITYVTDDRLTERQNGRKGVREAVELLKSKLNAFDNELTANYNQRLMGAMQLLSPQDFAEGELERHALLERLEKKVTDYRRLGLAMGMTDYRMVREDEQMYLLRAAVIDQVLKLDDPTFERLSLMCDIIMKADFLNKTLEIDKEHGLFFRAGEDIIIPEDLSSGEQHFVVQLVALLFSAERGSLILIDEPELSYHPAWQMDYLKNLKRIAEMGDYQFILATHSAQIFDYRWGYTIDLYKQTTNDAERTEAND